MFKENEKSKAICHICEKMVTTTFKISIGNKVIRDILVAVCDECETTIATLAQSTPEIKKQLNQKKETAGSFF